MGRYQFTPAANRALAAAAHWASDNNGSSLTPVELLLGLLEETESRAAEMLAAHGIGTDAVLAHWPEKAQGPIPASRENVQSLGNADGHGRAGLCVELQDALVEISSRLTHLPQPLEVATEHLLLGLVASGNELADWLGEHGFDADGLTHEICRLYGYNGDDCGPLSVVSDPLPLESGPLPVDDSDEAACPAEHRPQATDDGRLAMGNGPILRLLDAAANRAREGLRVLEDHTRFVWNDRHLTSQLKQLRHDLAAALSYLPTSELLAARDTLGDVGTTVATDSEADRPDADSVLTANAKRVQESLRSLEEYGKIVSPEMATAIEQLRYRAYTLERALGATSFGVLRLASARLYVLIDGRSSSGDFVRLVKQLVAAGVHVLQLRDKLLPDRQLLDRAQKLRELTAGSETLFVMNDRPDLAALAQADGVHVGQEELSVSACRAIVGPRMLVGVSTHALEQARRAVLDGANYLGVGPTFASRTKRFDERALRGPELLRAVQAEVRLPVFAIGGIDLGNLSEVLAAGVTRVAVSGAVLSSEDPSQAARSLLARLGNQ